MIQIRRDTFETNSSSTHSLVIGSRADIDAWRDGKVYLNNLSTNYQYKLGPFANAKFVPVNKAKEIFYKYFKEATGASDEEDAEFDDWVYDQYYLVSYSNFKPELDRDYTRYTTAKGEELAIVCAYGYDG